MYFLLHPKLPDKLLLQYSCMIKTQHFYLYIQGCHGGYFPQKIWVKIRSCFDRKRHIDCALKAGFSGYYLYMCAYLKISVKSQVNLYVISFEKIDKLLCFAHFNFIWRTIIAIIATTGIIIEFKRTLKGCANCQHQPSSTCNSMVIWHLQILQPYRYLL